MFTATQPPPGPERVCGARSCQMFSTAVHVLRAARPGRCQKRELGRRGDLSACCGRRRGREPEWVGLNPEPAAGSCHRLPALPELSSLALNSDNKTVTPQGCRHRYRCCQQSPWSGVCHAARDSIKLGFIITAAKSSLKNHDFRHDDVSSDF